jgi:Arm DNA-binding domain
LDLSPTMGKVMPNERSPLTKTKIEKAKIPPGARQIMLWDTFVSGFGVRCLPGGSKTFVFRYRPRLLKLGAFPSISLDDRRASTQATSPRARTRPSSGRRIDAGS